MDNTKEVNGYIQEIGLMTAQLQIRDGIGVKDITLPLRILPDTAEEGKEVRLTITV